MNSPEPKGRQSLGASLTSSMNSHEPDTPVMTLFLDLLDSYQTLSREEAEQLHRKLGRQNFSRNEHYLLAQQITNRPIKSFTTLTKQEADDLLALANEGKDQLQTATRFRCFSSDEEALAILQ